MPEMQEINEKCQKFHEFVDAVYMVEDQKNIGRIM